MWWDEDEKGIKMNEMDGIKIRIEIKDWLFNAGIVGLYRILSHAETDVLKKDNYIEFDFPDLEDFENKFFEYFSDAYEKDSLWFKLTEFCKNNIILDALSETEEGKIQDFIKGFDKGLNQSSYQTAYEIITKDKNYIKNRLKVVKDKKNTSIEKLGKIKEIFTFFIENKDIIQAKYVSYTVINKYWGSVSFLNTQQVKQNMFELYKRDFVEPVFKFLQAKKRTLPFGNCMVCNRSINRKSDGFEGLSWLKMDLDTARKTSVYWNHQPDIIVCPICNMVYSCVPAGFVTFRQKGLFINDNSSINRLIGINNVAEERLNDIENIESLEDITYTNIINMIRQRRDESLKEEVDNIQVIKYDYEKGYSFNLLSKQVIAIIEKSKKELNRLAESKDVFLDKKNHINLYTEVIDRIYRNTNLYPLIYLMTSLSMKKKRKNIYSNLIFRININFIGGDMSEKKIYAMKQLGLNLKKEYKGRDEENKIHGIAYRLLNNLKTKNTNGFLDVVINCHMHIGKEVPTLFVECIDDVERFQAYGYAFLLGFTGEVYQKNSKSNNQKNN